MKTFNLTYGAAWSINTSVNHHRIMFIYKARARQTAETVNESMTALTVSYSLSKALDAKICKQHDNKRWNKSNLYFF